jgi:predicted lipoprotein with Yx(FWY)xxD motif
MKSTFYLFLLSLLVIVSCSEDDPPISEPQPEDPMVMLSNDQGFGSILTDENGNTLYFFSRDAGNESNCSGSCIDNWPVFYIEDLKIDTGLDIDDFGQISRPDGANQTTYKGWPLYYFDGDLDPGDINGDGVNNVWFVAKPDYQLMLINHQLTGHDGIQYQSDYSEGQEVFQYLVDDYGRTLYGFLRDRFNINNFTKEDFSNDAVWPIYESSNASIPSTINSSLIQVINVHGREQITYNGWPLYYFGQDEMTRGNNKGISFPAPGVWPVITPGMDQAPTPENVLLSEHETLGNILTDQEGMTLYFFTVDSKEESNCIDNCIVNWPVFYQEDIIPANGLDESDFGEITRIDGSMQTTFKGWPLYYFINDNSAGDANGESINNVWFVAKPDYSIMLVNAQLVGHDGIEYNSQYEPGQEVTQYFVDSYGVTLYGFINDTFNKNNFTKDDFSNDAVWPIFEIDKIQFPSSIDASLFEVIDVHGRKQLTYKGWPLYYFGQDEMIRGNNKGISFPAPGVWPIITVDIGNAPS